MPQILLTGQLKEKPTYRVLCLYSSFVHAPLTPLPSTLGSADYSQPHSDNFGNFLRRLAFALASTFHNSWALQCLCVCNKNEAKMRVFGIIHPFRFFLVYRYKKNSLPFLFSFTSLYKKISFSKSLSQLLSLYLHRSIFFPPTVSPPPPNPWHVRMSPPPLPHLHLAAHLADASPPITNRKELAWPMGSWHGRN